MRVCRRRRRQKRVKRGSQGVDRRGGGSQSVDRQAERERKKEEQEERKREQVRLSNLHVDMHSMCVRCRHASRHRAICASASTLPCWSVAVVIWNERCFMTTSNATRVIAQYGQCACSARRRRSASSSSATRRRQRSSKRKTRSARRPRRRRPRSKTRRQSARRKSRRSARRPSASRCALGLPCTRDVTRAGCERGCVVLLLRAARAAMAHRKAASLQRQESRVHDFARQHCP